MKAFDWPEALKKTKPRMQVLGVLAQTDAPVTAPQICALLEDAGTPLWLSTVYRVLDDFEKHGRLRKTALPDGGMAAYELNGETHRHYAVCLKCHKMIPLEGCPLEAFRPQLGDFRVTGHHVQMVGFCAVCGRDNGKGE